MSKTAVVLFNLGGPDRKEAIKPFLFNFFMDKNIIPAPLPIRWTLARYISAKRGGGVALENYGYLGHRSPLLENTQMQAALLEEKLGDDYKVFICMRYWHPLADEVAEKVKAYSPDKIILLPLYPQFSTATVKSSLEDWDRAAAKAGLTIPANRIGCYPLNAGFITASADLIKTAYEQIFESTGQKPRLLFSAHGLPESVVKKGDPYQWQCEQSAAAIAGYLGIENLDWSLCYQSRVGPKKWIGPSTEEALQKAADDSVPVLIYPVAFTQEHVETLVEIEIEYRELAREIGVPAFARVPTVGTHAAFIEGLADLVTGKAKGGCACPEKFAQCGCRKMKGEAS
ncbi:MAG: ferrochelatase [Rhodospirillales bacterium]|nr:ferrochelatase [Rhodospirillales bacterium]